MEYLKITNWAKWQTYRKDRGQPPWIKIHRRLLRNPEWVSLTDSEKGQLISIWLLAADHDGEIPDNEEMVRMLCFIKEPLNLNKFIDLGFIESAGCHDDNQYDVKKTSGSHQNDCPKAEAEAEKKKSNPENFSSHAGFGDPIRELESKFSKPNIENIKNSPPELIKKYLKNTALDLQEKNIFPQAEKFKNLMLKKNYNPKAILHALIRSRSKNLTEKNIWGFCREILKTENGNYNEFDHAREAEKLKKDEVKSHELIDIINKSTKPVTDADCIANEQVKKKAMLNGVKLRMYKL